MRKAAVMLALLMLLTPVVYASDIVDLSPEDEEKAEALKGAVLKPLNIFLYVLFGIAGTVCLIFIFINGMAYMRAKNPHDRAEAEERLKYLAIGVFICVFGPLVVRTLL
jgi:hypothetical protein